MPLGMVVFARSRLGNALAHKVSSSSSIPAPLLSSGSTAAGAKREVYHPSVRKMVHERVMPAVIRAVARITWSLQRCQHCPEVRRIQPLAPRATGPPRPPRPRLAHALLRSLRVVLRTTRARAQRLSLRLVPRLDLRFDLQAGLVRARAHRGVGFGAGWGVSRVG